MTSRDLVLCGVGGLSQLPLQISRIEYQVEFGGETGHWAKEDPRSNPKSLLHVFFIIQRHVVKHLPKDARRAGVNETGIFIAFPIHGYGCGSRCFIQADFITGGEKGHIDGDAEWNVCLVDAIVTAFQNAIHRLIRPTIPKLYERASFTWPNLLRNEAEGCFPHWPELKGKIITALKAHPLLHSRDEMSSRDLQCPSKVKFVPPRFRFKGEPLLEDSETRKSNLSFVYDLGNIFELGPVRLPEALSLLGVREMSLTDFLDDLESIVMRNGTSFLGDQSRKWHKQLARILHESGAKDHVAKIPLIPLEDGRWVKPSEANLFWVPETEDFPIPNSLSICIVDSEACRDIERVKLFEWLGIRSINRPQICQKIIERQHSYRRTHELVDLVSDIMYIYETPTEVFEKRLESFLLAGVDESSEWKVYLAGELYTDGPFNSYAISKHANQQGSGVRLLHPAYLERFTQKEEKGKFIKWLISHTEVTNFPRLIDTQHKTLTTEFRYFSTMEIPELIGLLRDYRHHYRHQMDVKIKDFNGKPSTLREKLSEVVLTYSGIAKTVSSAEVSNGNISENVPSINLPPSDHANEPTISQAIQKYHSEDDFKAEDFHDSGTEISPRATIRRQRPILKDVPSYPKDPFDLSGLSAALPRSRNGESHRRHFSGRLSTRSPSPSPSHRRSASASKAEDVYESWKSVPPVFFENFSRG